jgi:membrane protease YdiL (CAAX protease family)
MPATAGREDHPALPLAAVLPGLIYTVILSLATIFGVPGFLAYVLQPWGLVLAVTPWITILVLRRSPNVLGYTRTRWMAEFGWGMLAGAIWRGLSLGFNLWWHSGLTSLGWGMGNWLGALILVPLIEETFFRGYLGRTFSTRVGKWRAIFYQAVLFSLHPSHWAQGWPHLLSILGFGLLAGWLVERRGSIWAAWGAHGFANVLPEILRSIE